MTDSTPAYGLWSLVVLNSAIFILFAFSFFKPQTARDWRTFGAFAAFIVALFVEMYGFPLTIRLAVTEETEMHARFGAEFERYAARTPRFITRLGHASNTA